MARRLTLILFATLLIFKFAAEVAAQPANECRIAGWNVLGFDPMPPWRAKNVAKGIAALNADVVGVVEVNPPAILDTLISELDALGQQYAYTIIVQSARQQIGVLHRTHVRVASPVLIPGSDLGNPANRNALFCAVKVGAFDFYLVVVHLKSARGDAERNTRTEQATVIADYVRGRVASGREKDVLILGDYNMIPGEDDENFEALGAEGYIRFVSSEDLVGQFSHIGAGGTSGNLLDGYGIAREHTREYVEQSLAIVNLNETFGLSLAQYSRRVSDHLPLVARFRTDQDDDENEIEWESLAAPRRANMLLALPFAGTSQRVAAAPGRVTSQSYYAPRCYRCFFGRLRARRH